MAFPTAGTILSEACVPGTFTYKKTIANGAGGTIVTYENDSVLCGYVPPATVGTILGQGCIPGTYTYRVITADGNGGLIETDTPDSPQCGFVPGALKTRNTKVLAKDFNTLIDSVNELFGDTHAAEGPSTIAAIQDSIKWGWGGSNVANVNPGGKITASTLNDIVNRINISTLRTNSSDLELVVTAVRGDKISDDFFNEAVGLLTTARTQRNNIAPTLLELKELGEEAGYASSGAAWDFQLENIIHIDFGIAGDNDVQRYNKARHFFNAGGNIRLSFEVFGGVFDGGPGNSFERWNKSIIEMGALVLNVNDCINLVNVGRNHNIGFAELSKDVDQLLYTSPAGAAGFGDSGYGTYSAYNASRLKVYGKITSDGKLILRTNLDHSGIFGSPSGLIKLMVHAGQPIDSITQPEQLPLLTSGYYPLSTTNNVSLTLPTPVLILFKNWTALSAPA